MNDQRDDKSFEEYLSRGSQLSRRYGEMDAEQVPSSLDQAVLARAHEALRVKSGSHSRGWMRWATPVAIAASTVLTLFIVIESGVEQESISVPLSAPQSPQPAAESSDNAKLEADQSEPSNAPPAPAERQRRAAPSAASAESKTSGINAQAVREQTVAAPRPVSGADLARTQAPERQASQSQSAADTGGLADARAVGPAVTQVSASRAAAPKQASPIESEQREQAAEYEEPAQWLVRIRALREEGKTQEANDQWREFRKAHPDYPVGDDDSAREK